MPRHFYRKSLSIGLLVSFMSACGGGSDSSDVASTGEGGTVLVSGAIQFPINTVVDADIAGENTGSRNDSSGSAQVLPHNLVQVQGFVSLVGEESDRDERDIYRVFLQQGQSISLDVTDFSESEDLGGALTLTVADVDDTILLEGQTGASQTFTASEDTEYLITVAATSGASKYILTLGEATPEFINATLDNNVGDDEASAFGDVFQVEDTSDAPILNLGEAIVKWANGSGGWQFDVVNLNEVYNSPNLDWTDPNTTWSAIEQLNNNPDVEYAEPNYQRKVLAVAPNDPLYGAPLEAPVFASVNGSLDLSQPVATIPISESQNSSQVVDARFISQFHYEQINLHEAWDIVLSSTSKQPGEDVIVAVADTGVFVEHEDLINKLTTDGFDFISNASVARDNESDGLGGDIDSNADDPGDGATINTSSWHGTHVAATVAAETNNNIGMAGVAWETQIMPLRVLGQGGGSSSDIMNSLIYAADLFDDLRPNQQADIINLSLGGGAPSQAEQAVIDAVRNAGVFIVAAAGNDGNNQESFPASYDGVISVGAINARKQKAFYSQFNDQVDVVAPGGEFLSVNGGNGLVACVGVLSAYVADTGNGTRQSSSNCLQGTSMATPHVSGVIALMKSVYPDLTPDEFDSLLATGEITDELGAIGRDDFFGHGLINAEKAVEAALRLASDQGLSNPLLETNVGQLSFNDANRVLGVLLSNTNGLAANPSVEAQVSADWLTVDSSASDNGLGEHRIQVNADGFGAGNYKGLVRFVPSVGNIVEIEIDLTVGEPDSNLPQAPHFVVFLEADGSTASTVSVDDDGSFSTQLDAGNYRVISGTDIDNDLVVCQLGETCGSSNGLLSDELLNVDNDNLELDFNVQLLNIDTALPALVERTETQDVHGAFAALRNL